MKKLLSSQKTGQKQPGKPSASTETNTTNSASQPETSPSVCLLHRSCKTIPISAFIEAYCNNDLTALIIDGIPDHEQLKNAWDEILFEYSTLIRTSDASYLLSMQRRMSCLQADIIYIENAVSILRIQFVQELVDELIEQGYYGEYDPANQDAYQRQLTRVISLAKNKVVELNELGDEYNRLNNTISGKKQTEEEFNLTIVSLAKYIGYRIDRDVVKVDEFAAILNLLLTETSKQKDNGQRTD